MTLAITTAHEDLLATLQRTPSCPRFVIIGAAALGHYVSLQRTTADVDVAILAEQEQIGPLLEPLGWVRDNRHTQRWRDKKYNTVDVLPATRNLIDMGSVQLAGDTKTMSLIGFDLALDHTISVPLVHQQETIEVACLGALVVLKMVAWLDRPNDRIRDLGDLAHVLNEGLNELDEQRWETPLNSLDFEDQSPFFVGLKVGAIAATKHLEKVRDFLAKVKNDTHAWTAVMARAGGYVSEDPERTIQRQLAMFSQGIAYTHK